MAAGRLVGQQTLPFAWMGRGYAFADFWQHGEPSLVKNIESGSTTVGRLAFYKKEDGAWFERTADLLADTTGCIIASKMLVADFNGDRKPDVFLACSGTDQPPFGGEPQRLLLSRADGRYDNRLIPFTAYAHGGSAIDVGGTGLADVVLTDTSVRKAPFYLRNQRDGGFTEVAGVMPASVQPVQLGQLEALPIYSAEFIDLDADGNYELWFGGASGSPYLNYLPSFYANDGSYRFTDAGRRTYAPTLADVTAIDVVVLDGSAHTLLVKNDYQSLYIDQAALDGSGSRNLYSHSGPYAGVGMTWFAWMHLTTELRLVSPELGFGVAVPLR